MSLVSGETGGSQAGIVLLASGVYRQGARRVHGTLDTQQKEVLSRLGCRGAVGHLEYTRQLGSIF